jgi:predicted nucleotidyltransferase component of viral defense system
VSYATPRALRMALERRLARRSAETGTGLDRLRRRVLLERIVARLDAAEPDRWVLKGGMALDVRLSESARATRDIDFGLRDDVGDAADMHERLGDALRADPDGDRFVLVAEAPQQLRPDGAGHVTWRMRIAADLADTSFGRIQVDVSPRAHELDATDRLTLANSLDFADIPAPAIEVVDVNRHAAEKLHALCRDYGDGENSRVRDLVDLVILVEHDLLDPAAVGAAAERVWAERDGAQPPPALPPLPGAWPDRYEVLAAEHRLRAATFAEAVDVGERLHAAATNGVRPTVTSTDAPRSDRI